MRSFSKKLAFVLAAAMVFTSFAPAAKAEAAKEMTINKSSQILYVTDGNGINDAAQVGGGKGNVSEYDFYVKNKPSDWKKTLKFEWSSSNEDVATVNQSGLTTAVAVGKATISCKVTDKDGDVVANSKVKVTVKANAADVEIKNASKISGTVLELKDGKAELNLDRYMYDADGNKTGKRGTYVTDYTEWMYEPKTGVEVNQSNGVFTFTAPGEYKLYCRTYQSSKYTKTTAESDPVVVTVVDKTFTLKQTTRDDLVLQFAGATDITAADVTIKQLVSVATGVDKVDYLVKDVTASADKTSYTAAVFYEFVDGAEYEVAVKGYETMTFKASKGAPKTIILHSNEWNMSDRTVTAGKDAKIYATLFDANDVNVTNEELLGKLTFNIKYADSDYERTDNVLYFTEVGERATVIAEYHTYEYDNEGNEKDVAKSAPHTFVSVAKGQELITGISHYTTCGYWDGDRKVVKMDDTRWLTVYYKTKDYPNSWEEVRVVEFDEPLYNNKGEVYFGDADFTSLNPDVLEVYRDARVIREYPNGVATDVTYNNGVGLFPRKVGTARVMVSYNTDINGKIVNTPIGTVTIEVKPSAVLDKISLDTKKVVLSTSPAAVNLGKHTTEVENKFVALEVKDQYDQNLALNKFAITVKPGATQNSLVLADYSKYGLKGKNELSQAAIDAGAVTYVLGSKWGNPAYGLQLDNDKFETILDSITYNKNGRDVMQFEFILTVEDSRPENEISRSTSLTVEARRVVDENKDNANSDINWKSVEYAVDFGSIQWNGNNVARFYTPNDWNSKTEQVKSATVRVYQLNNSARYDEIELLGVAPQNDTELATATNGYYYVINKTGVGNVSDKASVTAEGNGGSKLVYAFSHTKTSDYGTKTVVAYDRKTEGAGSYEFILYRVEEVLKNQYNPAEGTVKKLSRVYSKAISVSCDPGKYSFQFRNGVYANDTTNKELMKCFLISDRDGVKVSLASWDISDTKIKFNGTERDYNIVLNTEKTKYDKSGVVQSVFVDKIVVWEPVAFDNNGVPTEYAEYVTPVGYFVQINSTINK